MQELQQSLIFIIGILLTSGLFYLILYFGFRRKSALLFLSLFCFCQASKAFFRTDAELAMQILSISEQQSGFLTGACYTFGGFFLLAFLLYQFDIRSKEYFLASAVIFLSIFYFCRWPQLPVSISIGILISLYAFRKERLGAILSLAGLVVFACVAYFEIKLINKFGYFVGIIAFIVCMTLFVGSQIREQIRSQKAALVKSTALENQLLKKSLQPHFLFNSLMSLQEWIETKPEDAAQFVQALAEEFRAVCKMSGQKLISIKEEIAMCEAHLQIMSYRKHANFILRTEGIDGQEMVPPAIFHTLIENGLTHGFAERNCGGFLLRKRKLEDGLTYELFNDGSNQSLATGSSNGTGLKYVEARLEESYPGQWSLRSAAQENGWLVQISLKDA